MDKIFETLKDDGHPLDRWYYGHFHQTYQCKRHNVSFRMLDIMEFSVLEPEQYPKNHEST